MRSAFHPLLGRFRIGASRLRPLFPKLHTSDCSSACPGSSTWVDKVPSRDTPSLNLADHRKGVFPGDPQVARQRVGQIVREVARAAGITKRVYPHLLRHTMATRLLALGMEITDVQRFLGHEDIATTRRYAETTAAVLRRRFDRLTDPAAQRLVAVVQDRRGEEAAVLAAELLAERRGRRLT